MDVLREDSYLRDVALNEEVAPLRFFAEGEETDPVREIKERASWANRALGRESI